MELTNPDSGVDSGMSLDDAADIANSFDDEEEEQGTQDDEQDGDYQSEDDQDDDHESDAEDDDSESEEIEHDGKKYKVPKALKDSFLRQADYTHKTKALAEQRKAIEQHAQNLVAERTFYANQLSGFVQQLSSQIQSLPSDEQLLQLSRTDPAGYLQAKAERDYKLDQMRQAQQAQQYLSQQQEQDDQRSQAALLENERNSLMTKLPTWKDEKVAAKERSDISGYLAAEGYTQEEMAEVFDHRALLVARKAMLYDRMIAGKGKQQIKSPNRQQIKTLPAGNQGKPRARVEKSAVDRFRRSGSIDDALSILNRISGE